MSDIIVTQLNAESLHIQTSKDICYEISDYFKFEVPNSYFARKARKGWDGKIRMFDMRSNLLPAGLIDRLFIFCDDSEYSIDASQTDIMQNRTERSDHDEDSLAALIDHCGLPDKFELRDYQEESVIQALKDKRCAIVSPTASGKSLIIYLVAHYHAYSSKQVLIIVPTINLVDQMKGDFIEYGCKEDLIQTIRGGLEKEISRPIVVSTWQSLKDLPQEYFEQFDVILGDEFHLYNAASLKNILSKCINAHVRVGFSGTLDGMAVHQLVLEGKFGRVYQFTTTKELIDRGILSQFGISIISFGYSDSTKKEFAKSLRPKKIPGQPTKKTTPYETELKFIINNEKRTRYICKLASSIEGNTLVLFLRTDHGLNIQKQIQDMVGEDREVFVVYEKVKAETRNEIRAIVEDSKDTIVVASYGTFSTGVNIKAIDNIIFASPSKSRIRVLQSIGRGLRRTEDGKNSVMLYDLADDLRTGKRTNFGLEHMMERINIYSKEGLEFKMYNVPIEGE